MLGRAVFGAFSRSVLPTGARLCSNAARATKSTNKKRWIIAATATVGGVCLYGALASPQRSGMESAANHRLDEGAWENITPPNYTVSRTVDGHMSLDDIRLTLFQYQTCPFCCKVRAFLDYVGVPYEVVEVDPVLRQQIKFSSYKKVPILLVHQKDNCWQLNDSTVIISLLQSYLLDPRPGFEKYLQLYKPMKSKDASGKTVIEVFNKYSIMYGTSRTDMPEIQEEIRWRKWADDVLVHVLSPNVYRSADEALQAFNYFSEVGDWERLFPTWERLLVVYVGATAMYFVAKRLKKKYYLRPDVRESFYDECGRWIKNLGGKKFAGGKEPNLADLAVFGVLSSIEGCTAFRDALEHTKIKQWYDNMKQATGRLT